VRRRLLSAAFAAAALLLEASAEAHDYWLVPKTPVVATLEEAEDIPLSLFAGEDFVADEEKAFESARVARFTVFHGGQFTVLEGLDGAIPFAHAHLHSKGGYLFALDRNLAQIELPAEKFEEYLRTERLDGILSERARRGETASPGRERYRRCLKAFVEVGKGADESFDITVGQKLELSPGDSPVDVRPGGVLRFLVQFEGAPLDGAQVEALSRVGAEVRARWYRADEHGIVTVPIDRRALWLVRTVQMVRCRGCLDADWESTGASYVFASTALDDSTVKAPSLLVVAQPSRGRLAAAILAGFLVVASLCFRWWRHRRRGFRGPSP
jgi:uncharacterized GH25 family protein